MTIVESSVVTGLSFASCTVTSGCVVNTSPAPLGVDAFRVRLSFAGTPATTVKASESSIDVDPATEAVTDTAPGEAPVIVAITTPEATFTDAESSAFGGKVTLPIPVWVKSTNEVSSFVATLP